jgi:hypothetical protein
MQNIGRMQGSLGMGHQTKQSREKASFLKENILPMQESGQS